MRIAHFEILVVYNSVNILLLSSRLYLMGLQLTDYRAFKRSCVFEILHIRTQSRLVTATELKYKNTEGAIFVLET